MIPTDTNALPYDTLVEQIREDYRRGLTYRQLAKKYRKSLRDISRILKGEGVAVVEKDKISKIEEQLAVLQEQLAVLPQLIQKIAEIEQRLAQLEAKVETKKETEGKNVTKPPELIIIDDALEFLRKKLSQLYGAKEVAEAIIETLRQDPRPLLNPQNLHAFIKFMTPRAPDNQLAFLVINPLYAKFPNLPLMVAIHLGLHPAPWIR